MQYYGLFSISWLCPEHDLKLFTCFCVSPCRRKFVDQKLRRPAQVLGASRMWRSSSLYTFQQVWFSKGEYVESGTTTIVYKKCLRIFRSYSLLTSWTHSIVSTVGRTMFEGFDERVILVFVRGTTFDENRGGRSTRTKVFAMDGRACPVLSRYVPAKVDFEGRVR